MTGAADAARQLCVIGAAQHTVRDADAPEPLVSWEQRAHEAATGVDDALRHIDSLQVVYCQSWPYDDPAGRLAKALEASIVVVLKEGKALTPDLRGTAKTTDVTKEVIAHLGDKTF